MSLPVNLDVLRDAIPLKARRIIYAAFLVVLVISLAGERGYASLGRANPPFLIVALAVLQYLSVVVGGLALVNAKPVDSSITIPPPVVTVTAGGASASVEQITAPARRELPSAETVSDEPDDVGVTDDAEPATDDRDDS